MGPHSASCIGVIPARYGSTRLPGKALISLCGKPLIQWVYERAGKAKRLSSLVVATDDLRIRDAVESFGGRVVMTRADHPSGTDRIAEAAASLQGDVIINIQGDEPLVEPQLIDDLAIVMQSGVAWDMATAASPIATPSELANPAVVKVVWGRDDEALYFSRAGIPFIRDGQALSGRAAHWRHIGIYAYRRTYLQRLVTEPPCELEQLEKLEQLRALYIGCRMKVVRTHHVSIGVDTPDDVPRAEEALRKSGLV